MPYQTTRKRRVGSLLRQFRERSGLSAEDAARRIRKAQSTVSRVEAGQTLPSMAEMEVLLAYYNASDAEREQALQKWEDAKQDSTRLPMAGAVPKKFQAYLRMETEAAAIDLITTTLVPGLLQTPEYALAITENGAAIGGVVEPAKFVASRLERQKRVTAPDPLVVHAVLDEAVVRRVVGGAGVMVEQISHLLALMERDNITIQVLPFGAGEYPTIAGAISILHFADPLDAPFVGLEYVGGDSIVDDPSDVRRLQSAFAETARQALSPNATVNLLCAVRRELGE
ncbi:transcriptional regulator with XRE-family HTH domain [Saccharothrix coeruleofusca]|uniref:helix-turn-helix domain-containing protein n=1 Tax=Saccharothrix coeruleofusca TaxID=33919 RepID=UPI001AEA8CB7|nr:helix-turn-helix transcriptional regulator [Saccharothrix coeruleofusca]MBP2339724.1 transcriptional regulator with XRE-family HTH domain [Saccharothrix coeruleofusca]